MGSYQNPSKIHLYAGFKTLHPTAEMRRNTYAAGCEGFIEFFRAFGAVPDPRKNTGRRSVCPRPPNAAAEYSQQPPGDKITFGAHRRRPPAPPSLLEMGWRSLDPHDTGRPGVPCRRP